MSLEIFEMQVKGMTCGNCARSVERRLSALPGVTQATVDLENARARVEYDESLVKPETLANTVRQLGYEVPA
jgi:copper chaperone CopZ